MKQTFAFGLFLTLSLSAHALEEKVSSTTAEVETSARSEAFSKPVSFGMMGGVSSPTANAEFGANLLSFGIEGTYRVLPYLRAGIFAIGQPGGLKSKVSDEQAIREQSTFMGLVGRFYPMSREKPRMIFSEGFFMGMKLGMVSIGNVADVPVASISGGDNVGQSFGDNERFVAGAMMGSDYAVSDVVTMGWQLDWYTSPKINKNAQSADQIDASLNYLSGIFVVKYWVED